jgi:hypothetical protein
MNYTEKITNPEIFQNHWNNFLDNWKQTLPKERFIQIILRYLPETSPLHPSENMVWLYERLLIEYFEAVSGENYYVD